MIARENVKLEMSTARDHYQFVRGREVTGYFSRAVGERNGRSRNGEQIGEVGRQCGSGSCERGRGQVYNSFQLDDYDRTMTGVGDYQISAMKEVRQYISSHVLRSGSAPPGADPYRGKFRNATKKL
jgi:hypothetical protein